MSVEKIRALQQGSEDLSSAIAHLTGYHSCQIDDHKRCRAVCEAIHNDDADFATLDAEHYLRLLREIRINDRALGRTDFRESIPKEIHPWRRWFARSLDYGLWGAIVSYFYIVILRVRPIPGDFADAMISVLAMALFIPVEALLLSKFGTTPGKFAMGIRLESIQGGNLTFREAFTRSYGVYFLGVGCNIPIVEFAVKIVRYCRLTGRTLRRFARYDELEGPQDMPWDEVTEIIYVNQGFKRGAAAALILVLSFGINLFVVLDGIKPKYRGDELTVAQFADNYNAYLSWYQEDAPSYSKLQEDGSHYPIPDHTAVVQFNDSRQNRQMEFDYELEGESLQAVSITHDWDQVFYLQPLSGDALNAACSLLLAQDGCGIAELREFTALYSEHMDMKAASFDYKNLTVEWAITTELEMYDGIIFSGMEDDEENVTAELFFKVTVNEVNEN